MATVSSSCVRPEAVSRRLVFSVSRLDSLRIAASTWSDRNVIAAPASLVLAFISSTRVCMLSSSFVISS